MCLITRLVILSAFCTSAIEFANSLPFDLGAGGTFVVL